MLLSYFISLILYLDMEKLSFKSVVFRWQTRRSSQSILVDSLGVRNIFAKVCVSSHASTCKASFFSCMKSNCRCTTILFSKRFNTFTYLSFTVQAFYSSLQWTDIISMVSTLTGI